MSFEDVIRRQLDLFEDEHADLIADCDAAERAYDEAAREEAEERYGDYLDLVETGTQELAALRDNFGATMTTSAAEFNEAVLMRLPRFALEIEDV